MILFTDAYLLFWKHRKELELLRSLEMKRTALHDEALANKDLSLKRLGARGAKRSIWTTYLSFARGSRRSELDRPPRTIRQQMEKLQREEDILREKLPDYVKKLILGCTPARTRSTP